MNKCTNEFCNDCYFGAAADDFAGYNDYRGWASPPFSLSFAQACPEDLQLNEASFDVILFLQDRFSTKVVGNLITYNNISVSLNNMNNCTVNSTSPLTTSVNAAGNINFDDVTLWGHNNDTCSIDIHLMNNLFLVSDQSCDILLNGCANNQIPVSAADYDYCEGFF